MATPAVPLHIHALLSGVLPPFSSFLTAVLSHYQINTLHLDPSSLVLLSAFAFWCEAFVGVTPFVALLHHFFSLELISEEQCSGCASLKTAGASVPGALDAELLPKAHGFRRQWVQVKTAEAGVLFQPPLTPQHRIRSGAEGRPGGSPTEFFPANVGFRASADSLELVEVEHSLEQERLEVKERQVSLAEESLASREVKLHGEIDRGVAKAQRSLLLDYRAKLKLPEYRFCERRDHLKNKVNALHRRLLRK
ncbi:hypothetical protein D1007_17712 [Hordeum vulgare]|nr:hypothetical protein D1007_17712 [Hordeum vulgare]